MNAEINKVFAESIQDGNTLLAQTLLLHGADPNLRVSDRFNTPILTIACIEGHYDLVETLVRAGADIDATDELGRTPLIYATAQNDKMLVKRLLESAACREIQDQQGRNAKSVAIYRGHRRIAELITESL